MLQLTGKQVGRQDTLAEEVGAGGAQRGATIRRLHSQVYRMLHGESRANGKCQEQGLHAFSTQDGTVIQSMTQGAVSRELQGVVGA